MKQAAYLEDFRQIKLMVANYQVGDKITIDDDQVSLTLTDASNDGSMWHLYLQTNIDLEPHKDYYLRINNEIVHLDLGKITRSASFDERYYYAGPLGAEYHQDYCIFRLWSPVLKCADVVINNQKYPLHYLNHGLWEGRVDGDLELSKYHYNVRINEEAFDVRDPYGLSLEPTHTENDIIDLTKTYVFKNKRPVFSGNLSDAIIYEGHLKDMTYSLKTNGSCFQKMKDAYIVSHLKDLGITHLQIMPVNSFEEIDEVNQDAKYNWGYNPAEYFSLSGWFASNPFDPYAKINEFKQMIDYYHEEGLLITLDVVFNHVYKLSQFSYGKLVPGYVGRTDDIGYLTDGSGCGNDLATEHLMIRRLIIDVCEFFTTFYQLDGFRFDLMGLIDIETMNQISSNVKKLNPGAILYGEAWQMKTGLPMEKLASNTKELKGIGYFSDTFRNIVRGNPFNLEPGIMMGGTVSQEEVDKLFTNKDATINFIECHDNYTIKDQMKKNNPDWDLEAEKEYLKKGFALLMLAPGTPFIHAGSEFGRSKQGYANSYNLDIKINQISWEDLEKYQDVTEYIKQLVMVRKHHQNEKATILIEGETIRLKYHDQELVV